MSTDKKILICVLAGETAGGAPAVLDSLKGSFAGFPGCHFLAVASDASEALAAKAWEEGQGRGLATVLRLSQPAGSGEQQKLCYRWGLDAGYDFFVRWPPGGGAADTPALLALLHAALPEGADVVLEAPLAGIPLGAGGRVYTARFLRGIPFELNSNGALFDREILFQADYAGVSILQVPGVNSTAGRQPRPWLEKQAARLENIRYCLHSAGMFCSLKYRRLRTENYRGKTSLRYSSHRLALETVRRLRPATVLDIGCGPGFVAAECEKAGAKVTGLDLAPARPGTMTSHHRVELGREALPVNPAEFDLILMLDVIEHLPDPETFMIELRNRGRDNCAKPPPPLVLTTPNVAFAAVRLGLLLGRFNYAERGILDLGHCRLFTKSSLLKLLRECGFAVESVSGIGAPFEAVMPGRGGRFLGWLAQVLAYLWPGMFAFQFMIVCRPRPTLRNILADCWR